MADLSLTNFDYALKIKYPEPRVAKLFYEAAPTFALLPKATSFVGDSAAIAVRYGALTSISAAFSTAQTNKNHSSGVRFLVTRVKKYAIGGLDNEVIEASKTNEGALISAVSAEMEGAIQTLAAVASDDLFGDGSGRIGSIDTPGASDTLTLENSEDVRHFEPGMRVVIAENATSALRDSSAVGTVSAVNRSAGTLTMAANVTTTWSSAADGDLIFREGDYATLGDRNCLMGFAGWLPGLAAPAALFGVTRTTDVTRLAGVYANTTTDPGLSTEEALMLLATNVGREGGKPDLAVMGMTRFRGLVNALGSKVTYDKATAPITNAQGKQVATVGFDSIKVHGPRGVIDVIADPACPEDKVYCLTKATWKVMSLGALPRPVLQGGKYLRDSHDADSVELRIGFYANVCCNAPGFNGVYTF